MVQGDVFFLGEKMCQIHPFLVEDVVRLAAGEHPKKCVVANTILGESQLELYYPKAYLGVMNLYLDIPYQPNWG